MVQTQQARKPQRWDRPFGEVALPPGDVDAVLALPAFEGVDGADFPTDLPLEAVVANDMRLVRVKRGDVLYRQGEYGTSVFLVLRGSVRSFITPQSGSLRGGGATGRAAHGVLSRLFRGRKAAQTNGHAKQNGTKNGAEPATFSPAELTLGTHDLFGLLGAMTRNPRSSTAVAADDDTFLLELRWSGLRDMMNWSDAFRSHIEGIYREWSLWDCLQGSELFSNVDDRALGLIARSASFERYGDFDWTRRFKKNGNGGHHGQEPVVVEQGHYLDGILLIHSGFARVTERVSHEERTLGFAKKGDVIGLDEIAQGAEPDMELHFPHSLRALGYLDLVRVPTQIVETHVLPTLDAKPNGKAVSWSGLKKRAPERSKSGARLPRTVADFLVDHRFTNGAKAMVINTERCVNCDDCVRACAAAHEGKARFARNGPKHKNLMVANACMHCADPVCLIDCPTGAIHRHRETGTVLIDDQSCIGCGACAKACPYDNITMAELRDATGAFLIDADGVQIQRAEKCDLCIGRAGGPSCERACPHDALTRIDLRDTEALMKWLNPAQ